MWLTIYKTHTDASPEIGLACPEAHRYNVLGIRALDAAPVRLDTNGSVGSPIWVPPTRSVPLTPGRLCGLVGVIQEAVSGPGSTAVPPDRYR